MIHNVKLLNTYCIAEFRNVVVGGACNKHTALRSGKGNVNCWKTTCFEQYLNTEVESKRKFEKKSHYKTLNVFTFRLRLLDLLWAGHTESMGRQEIDSYTHSVRNMKGRSYLASCP